MINWEIKWSSLILLNLDLQQQLDDLANNNVSLEDEVAAKERDLQDMREENEELMEEMERLRDDNERLQHQALRPRSVKRAYEVKH